MKRKNPWNRIFTKKGFLFPFDSLAKFPYYVDVEATNNCNYDCLFCSRQMMKRPIGYIDMDVFKKIVDEISNYDCGLRFSRWGEPLLHPKIFDMVKYANERGVLTFVSTNGFLLNESMLEKVFQSGLDTIRFSFQGVTREGYKLMRNTKDAKQYDIVCGNIERLVKERDKRKSDRPFIIMNTTITDETEDEVREFKEHWGEIVDKVEVGNTTFSMLEGEGLERVKDLIPKESFERTYTKCAEILLKLSIDCNGDITPCCGDYDKFLTVGNVKEMSLLEAWNSDKINELREMVSYAMRHGELELCKKCYYTEKKFDELKTST